jgi:Ca2+/Na+ antiporter
MNEILLFLGGIVALVLGAESLVRGASKLALSFGISPLVVGLTVVAFGTSAPETTVSVSRRYSPDKRISRSATSSAATSSTSCSFLESLR